MIPRNKIKEGFRYGHWTVIKVHTNKSIIVQCQCGTQRYSTFSHISRNPSFACQGCSARMRDTEEYAAFKQKHPKPDPKPRKTKAQRRVEKAYVERTSPPKHTVMQVAAFLGITVHQAETLLLALKQRLTVDKS